MKGAAVFSSLKTIYIFYIKNYLPKLSMTIKELRDCLDEHGDTKYQFYTDFVSVMDEMERIGKELGSFVPSEKGEFERFLAERVREVYAQRLLLSNASYCGLIKGPFSDDSVNLGNFKGSFNELDERIEDIIQCFEATYFFLALVENVKVPPGATDKG